MTNESPITRDEMIAMFGEIIPMDAVALIWNEPETMTLGQIRARLREIAARPKTPTLLERLRSEAINWSATCGDLFGEAADEIERLRAALTEIWKIEDSYTGADWCEIEQARKIAERALTGHLHPDMGNDALP